MLLKQVLFGDGYPVSQSLLPGWVPLRTAVLPQLD